MYRAKELGRDRVEIFDGELQRHALIRLDTEVALRYAVENEELGSSTSRSSTSRPSGSAASRRSSAGDAPVPQALIQPAAFIGVAEDIGEIGAIGEWVLRDGGRRGRRLGRRAASSAATSSCR